MLIIILNLYLYYIDYISVTKIIYLCDIFPQLTAGTYHGTFGNLLPYFSSYIRKVALVISQSHIMCSKDFIFSFRWGSHENAKSGCLARPCVPHIV